jgi:hypothetical protein
VSDSVGNVIALDSDLKEVWRLDVGEPLTDSVTANGVVIGIGLLGAHLMLHVDIGTLDRATGARYQCQ